MGIAKIGAGFALAATAFGMAGIAHADFVKTVNSEAQCLKQDGTIVTVKGAKHCLVAVIPQEFQAVEYAGDLKGVTTCKKEDTRKTQIGDFCVIALEKIKAPKMEAPKKGKKAKKGKKSK